MVDFLVARTKMVDGQIRPNSVTNHAIIAAFLAILRENFVGIADAPLAYLDRDVSLNGAGRTLTAPMVLAKLLQALLVQPGEKVLEIGTATGYGAAVLNHLGAEVTALESDADLASQARSNLSDTSVQVVTGELTAGAAAHGPFAAILVNGAVDELPPVLVDQLMEGGRLAVIVGRGKAARACLYTKTGADLSARVVGNLSATVLPGFEKVPEFVF